jgi:aminoglycoside phosphotransferase (APT) family kinase protein
MGEPSDDELVAFVDAMLSNLDGELRKPDVIAQAISDNRAQWVMLYTRVSDPRSSTGRTRSAATLVFPTAWTGALTRSAAAERFMSLCEGVAVGWEALDQWGDDVARVERCEAGVANEVWTVRVDGRLAVGRLGKRSDADLAWETELLRHLDREGMTVPVPLPTAVGRHFAAGLVVMTYVEGRPPETEADWRRVADTLRQLHRLTHGWPQRPGWRSSTDLLHAEHGTKVDLGAMPSEAVARCRAAWARLTGRDRCVVHGDPNPGNILLTANRVGLIDWDESRVDVPDLDLALPHNAAGLDGATYDAAAQARAAWEAAACWDPSGSDEFAANRLAEVRAV